MTNDPDRPRKVAAVLQSSVAVLWSCGCLLLALVAGGLMLWFASAWHK